MTRLVQRTRSRLARDGPAAALVPLWLLFAWVDRGYQSDAWLGLAAWLAVLALEIAFIAWTLHARLPSRTCRIVLAIFAGYVLWVALSAIWAADQAPALEAAALAGFYLVFLALAFLALSQPGRRIDMRPYLLGAGVFMVALALVGILAIGGKGDLSAGWRFGFPLRYINVAGTFYLLLFWPLLWLAADPQRGRWHRAVGLGTAAALLQAALLTQSRGAMLGLAVGGVFYFLLSPARVRSLVFLVAPAGLLALSFPTIDAYYTQGPAVLGRLPAFSWVAGVWLAATAIGLGMVWCDERIRMGKRLRIALSVVVAAALLGGASLGALWFEREVDDVPAWIREVVSSFVGEEAVYDPGSEESRFTQGGSGGRGAMWRTAWKGFLDAPVIGNGAGSFPRVEERYGRVPDIDRSQAHSLEMDLLSETGVVGMVLFMAWFGLAIGVGLVRRRTPAVGRGWRVALVAGVVVWFAQAAVDWLWQVPSVTLGTLLLLAFAIHADRFEQALAPRGVSLPAPAGCGSLRSDARTTHTTLVTSPGRGAADHRLAGRGRHRRSVFRPHRRSLHQRAGLVPSEQRRIHPGAEEAFRVPW